MPHAPTYLFTRQQIEQPCVYVFWEGLKCLYVGAGGIQQHAHGMRRPFSSMHGHREEIERHDYRLEIYPQENAESAQLLEAEWIKQFTPLYNIQGVVEQVKIRISQRTVSKGKDVATGEFTVVTTNGEVLFSSIEKFERDRFFAQELKRHSDAATKQKANEAKRLAHS